MYAWAASLVRTPHEHFGAAPFELELYGPLTDQTHILPACDAPLEALLPPPGARPVGGRTPVLKIIKRTRS